MAAFMENKSNKAAKLSFCTFFLVIFLAFVLDPEHLLNSRSINFDVIAISETTLVKGKTPINSLN